MVKDQIKIATFTESSTTGGDDGMRQSLQTMYKQEGPEKASQGMLDQEIMTYISRAIKAGQ